MLREALVVYKKSKLALYVQEKHNKRVSELLDAHDPIVSKLQPAHEAHAATLAQVKLTLQSAGVPFKTVYRARLKRDDTQGRLVVTVGGDGTVLDASHRIDDSPVLGVNSDPERSVGFLCAARQESFAALLDDVLSGRLAPEPVRRLAGTVDAEPLPFLVLNELLVAHRNPAATVRYRLAARGLAEDQKSSGVWIAAPAGSTAAIASAGGDVQAIDDDHWQLRVREPYLAEARDEVRLLDLLLSLDEEIAVTSKMPQGVLYLDGPHVRMPFPVGAALRLNGRGRPLLLCVTSEMRRRREALDERLRARKRGG